jgi:hypothetical protein
MCQCLCEKSTRKLMCDFAMDYECEKESNWEYDHLSMWVKERKSICAAVQMSDLKIFIIWECSSVRMSPQHFYINNKWQRRPVRFSLTEYEKTKGCRTCGGVLLSRHHVLCLSSCLSEDSSDSLQVTTTTLRSVLFLSKFLKSFWWASPFNLFLRDFNFFRFNIFQKENTFRLIQAWKLLIILPHNMKNIPLVYGPMTLPLYMFTVHL